MASSSDGSGVSRPMVEAATWSAVMPARTSAPSVCFGCPHAVQPDRGGARVLPVSVPEGLGLPVREARQDDGLIAVRRERAQRRGELQRALPLRRPRLHHRPVREIDEAEPLDRLRRRRCARRERRHHGVEQRQRHRRAHPRRNVRRGSESFLIIMMAFSSSGTARCGRCRGRATRTGSRRGAASRVMARTAGASWASTPRPSAYVISFSVMVVTNRSGRCIRASRSPAAPSNAVPSGSTPEASIGAFASLCVR